MSGQILPAPTIEYGEIAPMLIVFTAAAAAVLVEAFAPRRARYRSQVVLAVAALAAALATVCWLAGTRHVAVMGSVIIDGPALFLQGTILLVSLLSVGLFAERQAQPARSAVKPAGALLYAFAPQAAAVPESATEREAEKAGAAQTEIFPLLLLAIGGLLLFPAAGDLLTMFVALEILSLPLYVLCGLSRRRRLLSQEAALKYFLLGAFSSAFFLYGMALLYGFAGTADLRGIAQALAAKPGDNTLALLGAGLLAVGLLFKVGAVPFQAWTPDVYQGAPTPVTAFMAAATKIAAFGALLRLFYVALPALRADWRPVMWAVAIATMLGGAVLAVTQTDVKRMLAYSAVTHTGFLLTGLIAASPAGLSATMFYLLAYGVSTVGAFAIIGLVRAGDREVTELARWAGLGKRAPLTAAAFALFLLAFAGIPLTSGFVSKFAVFQAVYPHGGAALVIIGVISSAIAAYFYVRVIVLMFFTEPDNEAPVSVTPNTTAAATILIAAAATVLLGAAPQPILDLATSAGQFIG